MEMPPPAAGGALWGASLVSRGLAAPSRQDFEPQRGSQGHRGCKEAAVAGPRAGAGW